VRVFGSYPRAQNAWAQQETFDSEQMTYGYPESRDCQESDSEHIFSEPDISKRSNDLMAMPKSDLIWFDWRIRPWTRPRYNVLSHAMHYGFQHFEEFAVTRQLPAPAVFCLPQHVRRMNALLQDLPHDLPYTEEQIAQAIVDTVAKNKLRSCYIRPLIFRGYGQLGVEPRNSPVQMIVAVWQWGAYLGADALERGVDVGVSSWRRMAPDTFPRPPRWAAIIPIRS